MDPDSILQETVIEINYTIPSGTNFLADDRYCLKISGEIMDITGDEPVFAGRLNGYKILTNLVRSDKKVSFFDVTDYTQETHDITNCLYDISKADWREEIEAYFEDVVDHDLLILSSIELLPKYRGAGNGSKILKDFYNTHVSGCGLFAVNYTPIQFRGAARERGPEWEYDKLEQNEDRATFRLAWKLNKLGFKNVPGDSLSVMVINTSLINAAFDSIELS